MLNCPFRKAKIAEIGEV